ncbi:hypothetical protein JL107_09010 [Nakamurella flavida]|uniref:DUF2231 domain-containing protein n=1 Tax=Nakamurella flavida TaxID=363630 RepID=A0A939C2H5_9ACTN|nr:DUF2231 domain-containing protein [Nakamurella flavida]MBM9476580.1 hypothetical protein [Nakamurella flavida]MDP9778982.1 putative membrane protein [Nakamurella flavida]
MTEMTQAWPARAVRPLERMTSLDRPADLIDHAIDTVPRAVRRVLHGTWLGHPVHPILITVPIGCWTSAGLLDIGSKNHAAAKRLVGAGLIGAVAAAATGWADWRETTGAARRVGLVHASANAVAVGLYWRSWRLRAAGRHGAGALGALAGAGAMGLGGFLGGHMSYALGANVGSANPARAAGPAPVVPDPVVPAPAAPDPAVPGPTATGPVAG